MACITPWLSDLTRKWMSEYPRCIAKRSPSSIATISAHSMLWLSLSQLKWSFQASHLSSKMIPIPHEEEALTQNWTGEASGGLDREELEKVSERQVCYQAILVRTLELGVLQMKGEEKWLKEVVNLDIAGKCEHPLGSAREQWTKVPRTDSVSFLENFWPGTQSSSLDKYLSFFDSGIWTVLSCKFHVKPRYLNSGENGLVLDSFHGHPRHAARL